MQSDRIKSWPAEERPREKLLAHGAEHLSPAELLAVVLRVGQGTFQKGSSRSERNFDAVTASVAWTQPEKRGHRWLFAVQTLCWIQALHTNKTYDDLSKKLRAIPALANAMAQDADSLIEDPHVSSQLREQAREVICRYRQSETAFDNILGVLEIIDEF